MEQACLSRCLHLVGRISKSKTDVVGVFRRLKKYEWFFREKAAKKLDFDNVMMQDSVY